MRRIKKEHPEDDGAIENDRVKGYLRVSRAFGAGFLKQVNIINISWFIQNISIISFVI